ncbi:2-succinyl-6-hydroxy-2,4-cyclohexadiene-1-carboxylate synthase [Heyndrickxia sp. FSL K6-6286]|uniref:2-succinyl-6-hydroxy-2, 4-cyclohexadiene-1-carboxylate synthase n=1 Tax=Heyndrickxia sp. FSL K6-6286 TaxID=2921510 RepID=UPI003159FF93
MNIHVNGVNYHVEVIGSGEPLLLLHGFTGDCTTWNAVVQFLNKRYQCILIDILGHGKTECPKAAERYQIELVAHDIKDILFQLKINKIKVLGYSMGGRLALTFATCFPDMVSMLLLESVSPGLKTEEARIERRHQDERLAKRIIEEGIESFVDYWTDIPLFKTQKRLDKARIEQIRWQRLQNNPLGLANSLIGMGTGSMPSLWRKLSTLEMPVYLITGSLDEKFCLIAKEMQKWIPNARHETILDAGHAIHVEDSRKFGTIIEEFLSNK